MTSDDDFDALAAFMEWVDPEGYAWATAPADGEDT